MLHLGIDEVKSAANGTEVLLADFQLGVPEETARRWQADFLHQFILAGASSR